MIMDYYGEVVEEYLKTLVSPYFTCKKVTKHIYLKTGQVRSGIIVLKNKNKIVKVGKRMWCYKGEKTNKHLIALGMAVLLLSTITIMLFT